jgi:hypothetical protein
MNYDADISILTAETLAIQMVLSHVFDAICKIDPRLAEAVRTGFDNAANEVENTAIMFGKTASTDIVKALAVVESLRAATFERRGSA